MLSSLKKWMTAGLVMMASIASAAEYEAGKHYKVLEKAVPVMQDGQIHVEEAFWYGCSHCYSLESVIVPWKKTLAKDVTFSRVPAMFGRAWVVHAQLYYTADALGVLEQVHGDIFNAIHLQKLRLVDKNEQRDFLMTKAGVSAEEFDKAYESFAVRSKMTRGDKRVRAFEISGVPTLIVNGQYVVDASSAGSQAEMVNVVNYLIEQERAR
ncbi:thiol:disulfide interchange protein DsbA/DsbL [Thalassolituus maritimus]|uniref:Thiol:disulfide interchange protein n=1 Tax=Thalassolituus maritimus TaxID=484498 RepID=A0ABP9ZXE1_9GAMM|nr:thiol:disulfide interchange protein DsbA/DsbL [Pseudomonadota bacterium]MEC8104825.1 thiol:disulfide interchange protein DsbA/DsbL [Pseudomonadota bacterium]